MIVVRISLLELATSNSMTLLSAEKAFNVNLAFGAVPRHVPKGTTIMALELRAAVRSVSRFGAQTASDIGILPWPLAALLLLSRAHVSNVTRVSTVTAHNRWAFAYTVAHLATMEALHHQMSSTGNGL